MDGRHGNDRVVPQGGVLGGCPAPVWASENGEAVSVSTVTVNHSRAINTAAANGGEQ